MKHLYILIIHWYHKSKLRWNLLVIFLLLFISILFPSTLLLLHYNNQNALEEMKELASNNLFLSSNQLFQILKGSSKISTSLLSNNTLQNFLKKDYKDRSPNNIILLENTLYNLCSTSANHLSAYLYDNNGACYYSDATFKKTLTASSIEYLNIFPKLQSLEGKILCVNSTDLYTKANGLSIVRILNNLDTLQPIGTLVLNIAKEDLQQAFSSEYDTNNYAFIYDDLGRPLLDSIENNSKLYATIKEDQGLSNSFAYNFNGKEYILCYYTLSNYGLTIGTLSSIQEFSNYRTNSYTLMLIIFIVATILLTLGSYIVSASVTNPIVTLAQKMNGIPKKEFKHIQTNFETTNEIGYLTDCYNQMTDEIQELLTKEVNAEKHRRHLELNLLQAQFKPHFLYNTIDIARSLCMSDEPQKANNLLKAMGTYYQSILNKGYHIIPLKDELNTIKQYETILSCQDNHNFQINYDIDPDSLDFPVLKFILQPLVENCIKHGLYGLDDGTITITASLCDTNTFILSVRDDGIGMDQQLVTDIINANFQNASKSFGLAATLERMHLHYGDNCHIEIISELHHGSDIRFTITERSTKFL